MSPEDAGREAIAVLRNALEPPDARVRDDAAGFTWRPHAFAQRIRMRAFPGEGAIVVEASTTLLRDVAGRAGELAALAAWNAREPGLSSLRWHSGTREVSLRASVVVRPGEANAAARRLAHAALLQVGEALRAADALALAIPGAPLAEDGAPAPEPVAQVDAARAYELAGASAAISLGEQVARLATSLPAPWRRATRAAHGVDLEIDVRLEVADPATTVRPGGEVALLRVTSSQPHPRLGPGLVLALLPPAGVESEPDRAATTAALLQDAEAHEWTGVDALGGWCVHPAAGLSHVTFVPAIAVEADTALELATQAVGRARWVARFLADVRALRERAATPPSAT
jgi:hypothetical protein